MTNPNHSPQRTIEQVISEGIANEATNTPITKSAEQLHAEFKERQLKRKQAALVESTEPEFDLSQLTAKSRLKQDAELISTAKLNFAIAQVRTALRYSLSQPELLSCQLCNHPCFSLLFRPAKPQQSWDNLADLLTNNSYKHSEVQELACLLKAALPLLAASFENQSGLNEVWVIACLSISKHPLPYALLNNLQSQPFAAQVLTSYQLPAAKQQARCTKTGSTLTYLGNLLFRVRSWFVLRRVVIKAKS